MGRERDNMRVWTGGDDCLLTEAEIINTYTSTEREREGQEKRPYDIGSKRVILETL